MNTEPLSMSPLNQLSQAAKEAAQRGTVVAKDATAAAKDFYQTISSKVEDGMVQGKEYAQHATDTAKDMYQSAAVKAEETLVQSKDYVRQNPFPVVLGAFAIGMALGCMVGMTRREEPTFRQRYLW